MVMCVPGLRIGVCTIEVPNVTLPSQLYLAVLKKVEPDIHDFKEPSFSLQKSILKTFCLLCREEGHDVEIRVTYEPGDSDRIVEEALASKNVDVLVAAGGDGSVNEVRLFQDACNSYYFLNQSRRWYK